MKYEIFFKEKNAVNFKVLDYDPMTFTKAIAIEINLRLKYKDCKVIAIGGC